MNETLRMIEQRFSCRAYQEKPVSRELIDQLLKAGLQAPSALNRQPWKIVVITNKELLTRMDNFGMKKLQENEDQSAYERFMKRGGKLFYNAPAMFVILQRPGSDIDTGILAQNIVLAAESLGLNSVHCGMARLLMSEPEIQEKLRITPEWEFGHSILIGYGLAKNKPHEISLSQTSIID